MLRQAVLRCAALRQLNLQAPLRRGLATPGDFDLLADDVGLARIDGRVPALSSAQKPPDTGARSWDATGFLVNDVQHSGAVLLYSSLTLSWRVGGLAEVTLARHAPAEL